MIKTKFSFLNLVLGAALIGARMLLWMWNFRIAMVVDSFAIGLIVYRLFPWFEKHVVSVWDNVKKLENRGNDDRNIN